MKQPARDWTGQTLYGKWTVERMIGVGGTSTVLEARHRNGRRAALKLLHPHLAAEERTRERFLREGRLANLVKHPGVVAVLDDFTTEDGAAVLVLELVEGMTLAALAKEHGGVLAPAEVVTAARAVLEVLVVAHAANVIHRDIKPENILLGTDGTYKLADFGLAALGHELGMLTGTNAALGTPAYMAPEQARGDSLHIDARTDIWGLGATMFTLLTGRYLYASSAPKNLVVAAATEAVPPIASMAPDMDGRVASIIERAVRPNKEERWPNARAMLAELEAVQGLTATSRRVPSAGVAEAGATTTAASSLASLRDAGGRLERRTRGGRWGVAAGLGVTAVGAALLWQRAPATPESVDLLDASPVAPAAPVASPTHVGSSTPLAPATSPLVDAPTAAAPPVAGPEPSDAASSKIAARLPRTTAKAPELPSARPAPSALPASSGPSAQPLRAPAGGDDLSVPDDVLDRRD